LKKQEGETNKDIIMNTLLSEFIHNLLDQMQKDSTDGHNAAAQDMATDSANLNMLRNHTDDGLDKGIQVLNMGV
jgi:hypothetical protein